MSFNELNRYRGFSRPFVHTAPLTAITSSSICETSNVVTTVPRPSYSAPNSSPTPRAESPRDGWRGFSQDEIDYGIRAAGGL